MSDLNFKFLNVLSKEAFKCLANGDTENGESMLFTFMKTIDPTFADEAKKDKKVIYNLIKIKNQSKDESEKYAAVLMLKFLKSQGVEL